MNRNVLKIIAVVSMLLDHIGAYFFPSCVILRIIGRLAFPIFAFFIAEGLKHTSNKKRYISTLLTCALISQIPYSFLHFWYNLNIIFTFLIAILVIYLIENYKKHFLNIIFLILIAFVLIAFEIFGVLSYGIFGILLIIAFYFCNNKKSTAVFGALILLALAVEHLLLSNLDFSGYVQFFAVLTLPLLFLFNGKKGKLNLKYLFYIFYPLHLIIILIVQLII